MQRTQIHKYIEEREHNLTVDEISCYIQAAENQLSFYSDIESIIEEKYNYRKYAGSNYELANINHKIQAISIRLNNLVYLLKMEFGIKMKKTRGIPIERIENLSVMVDDIEFLVESINDSYSQIEVLIELYEEEPLESTAEYIEDENDVLKHFNDKLDAYLSRYRKVTGYDYPGNVPAIKTYSFKTKAKDGSVG